MKYLLMKITPSGTQLEYDQRTYRVYYRFRKDLQRLGLHVPNPNGPNATRLHPPAGDWGPSDLGFSLREQYLKSSLNYDTPEEQNKRLQFASILFWIKENAFAGRQSLNRSSSSAQIGPPGFAERSRSLSVTAKV